MTRNSEEAARLIKKLQPIPTLLGKAVGRAIYSALLNNTLQDSGEAAYNWRGDINTSRNRPFVDMRGRAPVGATGDKRSAGFERNIVIDDRFANFTGRLHGKDVKTIHFYNPIEDDAHAINARLEQARAIADNPGWLEDVAKGALKNANL